MIEKLKTDDELIIEQLVIDLEYIYKKYDKKINPKYREKINIEKINIMVYNSGINVLLKEDYNEKKFWEIAKIIIKDENFTCIKIRKDKDFTTTTLCTSKQYSKIKSWFTTNTLEFETLSVFFVIKNNENIAKELREINTQL